MWKYKNNINENLFSQLNVPDGIDKDTLINNILLKGGEFEVIYTDPDFIELSVGVWSNKWYKTFIEWIKVLSMEYNPIENYDRIEDWTDTNNRTDNETHNNTINKGLSNHTTTNDSSRGSGNIENTKSAYDNEGYSNYDKSISSNTNETNGEVNSTGTDNTIDNGSVSNTMNGTGVHTGRIHGNIGVKTTQSMILETLSLAEWNLYEHITDIFLKEYIIPIY